MTMWPSRVARDPADPGQPTGASATLPGPVPGPAPAAIPPPAVLSQPTTIVKMETQQEMAAIEAQEASRKEQLWLLNTGKAEL